MKAIFHQALSCLSLAGRLPVKLQTEADFSRLSLFLPLIGLPAGLCMIAGLTLGNWLFGPGLLAVLSGLVSQYAAFNLFHFDGLLDTADASGVFGDAQKRLSVLKDPRIGVFAFFTGFIYLTAKLEALRRLLVHMTERDQRLILLACCLLVPVAGRLAGIFVAGATKTAENGGLAALVGRLSPIQAAIGYCLAASPVFVLTAISLGALPAFAIFVGAACLAMLAGLAVGLWYRRCVGGYTGDAIGAAIELGELSVLLALTILLT